jgi:hypothetical protein
MSHLRIGIWPWPNPSLSADGPHAWATPTVRADG